MKSLEDKWLAEKLELGIVQFNKGEYFDCHETLEEVWRELNADEKEITQAIIQIAVAYYHLLNSNSEGARKLLKRGSCRLRERVVPSSLSHLDIGGLNTHVLRHLQLLESGSAPELSDFPRIANAKKKCD